MFPEKMDKKRNKPTTKATVQIGLCVEKSSYKP
jgi:hypothetical protein